MSKLIGSAASSDTDFNLAKASLALRMETIAKQAWLNTLTKHRVINIHSDLSVTSASAKLNFFTAGRHLSTGQSGDVDAYSNRKGISYSPDSMDCGLLQDSIGIPLVGTFTQQVVPFSLLDAPRKMLAQYFRDMYIHSLLNQLGGNTNTAITANRVSDQQFTGSTLLNITGFNTPTAPTYRYTANHADMTTAESSITSSNTLRLRDFMTMAEILTSTGSGVPFFEEIDGEVGGLPFNYIALVGETGMNQLKNDAVTVGQGLSVPQLTYAGMAGGSKPMTAGNMFVAEGFLFIKIPNQYLPRGSNSGTEISTVRRAIILGKNAVDVCFGKGQSAPSGLGTDKDYAGFRVLFDDNTKKNNEEATLTMKMLGGIKKTRAQGQGANASTYYDKGAAVLSYYSAY